ncbi:hypothetical protein ACNEV8_004943, partial [Escherichia coli]
ILPHFSLAFIAAKFRLRILGADHPLRNLPDGAETTLTCKVSFQTDNEMRICDKFQSKIHKTDIMLFSGEQSIPETEYLVKAVYYTGCKQYWL